MRVEVRNISKFFGDTPAVKSVNLQIQDHELFFLLGPSGCGKTTLLRLIAGFYEADEGEMFFGERRMNGVPPYRRNTAMVFQNYALWPHMTVLQNVMYGLDVRGMRRREAVSRAEEALDIVQMRPYSGRKPNQLSGGQQQRIALARALVIRPDVLLLDEPLSNLDAKLRLEMREEIRRIHAQTQITTIYVTHDQKEALSLAERIAIMRDGQVEQTGTPRELYRNPGSSFAANFLGETNWLSALVREVRDHEVFLDTPVGAIVAQKVPSLTVGQTVQIGFRPEAVQLAPVTNGQNSFEGVIESVSYGGDTEQYSIRLAPGLAIKATTANPVEKGQVGAKAAFHIFARDIFLVRV